MREGGRGNLRCAFPNREVKRNKIEKTIELKPGKAEMEEV